MKAGIVDTIPANNAHNRRERIRRYLHDASLSYLEAGISLKAAVDAEDYKVLGYERTEDYFEHEFNLKRSTAYNLIGIAEKFYPILAGVQQIGHLDYTRLVKALPLATEANAEEWLHKASSLPPEAYENELRIAKGMVSTDECSHDDRLLVEKCKLCHKNLSVKEF